MKATFTLQIQGKNRDEYLKDNGILDKLQGKDFIKLLTEDLGGKCSGEDLNTVTWYRVVNDEKDAAVNTGVPNAKDNFNWDYMVVECEFSNGKEVNDFLKISLPKYKPYLENTNVEQIRNDIKKQIPSRFADFFGVKRGKWVLWNLRDDRKFTRPVTISFKVKIS